MQHHLFLAYHLDGVTKFTVERRNDDLGRPPPDLRGLDDFFFADELYGAVLANMTCRKKAFSRLQTFSCGWRMTNRSRAAGM